MEAALMYFPADVIWAKSLTVYDIETRQSTLVASPELRRWYIIQQNDRIIFATLYDELACERALAFRMKAAK